MTKIAMMGLGVAGLLLTGCTAGMPSAALLGAPQIGALAISLPTMDGRSVQYLAGDINAFKVTIMDGDNGNAVIATNTVTGATLASHLVANKFSFTVDNLKVNDGSHPLYHYNVKVEAFLESGATTLIGSSVSASTFTIASGATTALSLPSLALAANLVGSATSTGSTAVSVVDAPAPAISWK